MNADEITIEYYQLLNDLQNYNSDLNIVLSVSPVRHLKDGFYENTVSKAILSIALYQIAERFENVNYFPSFELMNDDLRDYRYYTDDMLHPSAVATDYIFNFFGDAFFSEKTKNQMADISKIVRAASHRILHPGTKENQAFAQNMLKVVSDLEKQYPKINFVQEKAHFESLLK
jgi:hypothetical protein